MKVKKSARPKAQTTSRLPETAPVTVTIYKYTNSAADFVNGAAEDRPLYQVMVSHPARPSVAYNMVYRMNSFLQAMAQRDPTWPDSLYILRNSHGVSSIPTRTVDPDDVGYVPYRPAFYVEEDSTGERLENFMNLMDEFFAHLQGSDEFTGPLEETIEPHEGVVLPNFEAQSLVHVPTSLRDAQMELSLKIFDAYPPNGQSEARHLVRASIQIESDDTMGVVFSGKTFPFRRRFEDAGVGGTALGEEGMENRPYIRVVEPLDVAAPDARERIKGIFGATVLKAAATMVVVEDVVPAAGTPVAEFINELRRIPSLHFV